MNADYHSLFGPVSPEHNSGVRNAIAQEQDLEAFGIWDCKCGHSNTIPPDTIQLFCSKCREPRKFHIMIPPEGTLEVLSEKQI